MRHLAKLDSVVKLPILDHPVVKVVFPKGLSLDGLRVADYATGLAAAMGTGYMKGAPITMTGPLPRLT